MKIGRVRIANTATLVALNQSSVDRGHLWVLTEEMVERLDPEAVHVCWATFPHSAQRDPTVQLQRVASDSSQLDDELGFANGGARNPHLRTAWLVSVKDGPPVEAIIHLDHQQVTSLPEYQVTQTSAQLPNGDVEL